MNTISYRDALQIMEGFLLNGTVTDIRRFCVTKIRKAQESGQYASNLFYVFLDALNTLYGRNDITIKQFQEIKEVMLNLFD